MDAYKRAMKAHTLTAGRGVSTLCISLLVAPLVSWGADLQRGEGLYLNHCLSCHESTAHIREDRHAETIEELRRWVVRWAVQLNLGWSRREIEDVTTYLNRTYYRFSDVSMRPRATRD